jgi:hypothetical protein
MIIVVAIMVIGPGCIVLAALLRSTHGGEQLLKLMVVEKDPATLLALIDQDPVALVGAHRAAAFGADEGADVAHGRSCH